MNAAGDGPPGEAFAPVPAVVGPRVEASFPGVASLLPPPPPSLPVRRFSPQRRVSAGGGSGGVGAAGEASGGGRASKRQRRLMMGGGMSSGGGAPNKPPPPPPLTSADLDKRGRDRLLLDYSQHFVNCGERPQNFIRDVEPDRRFLAYFRLKELMELKRSVIRARATPAQCIRFDVILVDPPWPEYAERCVGAKAPCEDITPWTLDEIKNVAVEEVADAQSFCFLWCGVKHLEEARDVLSKWGFRRCEDVCWVKTNKALGRQQQARRVVRDRPLGDEFSFLQRTTEHCLMGIKGVIRRSQDSHFIHANLDTDVIISEEPQDLFSTEKPAELYDIIERFCLGRRRLELFGLQRNVRDGWLTIGNEIRETKFDAAQFASWFEGDACFPEAPDYVGGRLLGSTEEIETLRPKSPPRETRPATAAPQQ